MTKPGPDAASPAASDAEAPLLTIAVPTYRRPALLARALRSVQGQRTRYADRVEVIVSDNHPASGEPVARAILARWRGPWRYLGNRPDIGMIANFNQCVTHASGRWLLILHDDDYLLPASLDEMCQAIEHDGLPVRLFGAWVVDERRRVRRRQVPARHARLTAGTAVERLLSDSSFVRFPAVVTQRDAYLEVGPFRDDLGGTDDFDMWIRLFGRQGVELEPAATSGYTIHQAADTSGMFHAGTIDILLRRFEEARGLQLVSDERVDRARADWFHQFILGGTYRQLLNGDRVEAQRTFRLFDLPSIQDLGPSKRWAPVRWAFGVFVQLPEPLFSVVARLAALLEPRVRSWA